ncbi:hypothetical protein [Epilithonimonas hominis]|uniref:hypothetical protein n=1 Tax=Epilithonimonas hominis TaxID=420404 RepID=UPI00289BD0AB|nr:hypothetical protein [Epilithonimonas hominis]
MKNFIVIVLLIFIVGCNKLSSKKYFVVIERIDYTFDRYGSEEREIDSFEVNSVEQAYENAYRKFKITSETSEALRSNNLNRKVVGFDLLNSDKQSIKHQLSRQTADSIEYTIDILTKDIGRNLKEKLKSN